MDRSRALAPTSERRNNAPRASRSAPSASGRPRVRAAEGFEGDWRLNAAGGWELSRRRTLSWREFSRGWTCDHSRMRYCCRRPSHPIASEGSGVPVSCGHLVCPCGLAWDEGAEK